MPTVKIYTTPTCVYCRAAKDFFKEHNIAYEELDVTRNEAARQEMIQKSGQMGVPVIDVNGQLVVGFNKGALGKLLGVSQAQ